MVKGVSMQIKFFLNADLLFFCLQISYRLVHVHVTMNADPSPQVRFGNKNDSVLQGNNSRQYLTVIIIITIIILRLYYMRGRENRGAEPFPSHNSNCSSLYIGYISFTRFICVYNPEEAI